MQVVVDSIFKSGNQTLVMGWLGVGEYKAEAEGEPATESVAEEVLLAHSKLLASAKAEEKTVNIPFVTFPRPDVVNATEYNHNQCTGYIAYSENHCDELTFRHDNDEVSASLSNAAIFEELHSPDPSLLLTANDVTTFIEQHGFFWGQKTHYAATSEFALNLSHIISSGRLHIDECIKINAKTLCIMGWAHDPQNQLERLHVKIGNALSDDILNNGFRFIRPDLNSAIENVSSNSKLAFLYTIELVEEVPEQVVILTGLTGEPLQHHVMAVKNQTKDEVTFTSDILSALPVPQVPDFPIMTQHLLPLLENVWKERLSAVNNAELIQFGESPLKPKLSLIIPIYGRYDFVQHQMAQFSLDKDFADIEVIYLLDDPRIRHEFVIACHGVFEVFKVPFKVVLSEKNLGFAGANNLAVNYATAEHIALVNSDVMPKTSGAFSTLLAQYEGLPDAGILGGILLYEDDTIQHAGMMSVEDPHHPGIWMNYHPNKGFPISSVPAFEAKETPTVTGAFMLLNKQLYLEVGGLDTVYILGDFEDSDLCYKVREKGLKIYLSGKVQMYHMERLSQSMVTSNSWKHTLSMLNGLKHTLKWDKNIRELNEQHG